MSVRLGPLALRNPVVAASGFFGYGDEYAALFDIGVLGAFTTARVGLSHRDGAPSPRLVETPSGVLRARDTGRMECSRFVRERLPFLREARARGVVVVVHLHGEEPGEVGELVARLGSEPGIDAYEVAVTHGADPAALVRAAASAAHRPVVARIPPAIPGIVPLAIAALDAGAQVLSLVDAVPALAVDTGSRRPALGSPDALLSGPAIRPIALRCVLEVAESVDAPIIGMGGVATANDAVEFLLAGAHAVGVASAVMANPMAALEVLEGLAAYCEANAWGSVAELTGSLRP